MSRDALDETKLSKDNAIAIKAFNTRNLQLAEYPYISCMKLCFKRDVTELAACKKPIEGDAWKRLLDHYKSNPVVDDSLPTGYICDYCIKNFVPVYSIPSAKNVVWQDLVDINKVYSALCKLREINPLYREIQLPADASELELNLSITEHITEEANTDEDNCLIDHDDDEKDPMVRKVEKDEAELYKNYTIQLLYGPRQNEKATDLYQMLRINEPAIDGDVNNSTICVSPTFSHLA